MIYVNGHYVSLGNPALSYGSGNYDYKVHPTGNLSVSGYVAFTNNQPIRGYTNITNSVSGYGASGYFGVKDGSHVVTHSPGLTRCKMGQRTGLSCGEIVNGYTSYTTAGGVTRTGMVAVGKSTQRVIAYEGDSGGPVFTKPASDGTIIPAGLVSGANAASSGPCDTNVYTTCTMYYMPIDRINDQQPMQIKTMTGSYSP